MSARHYTKRLTSAALPWKTGVTTVMRDRDDNMTVCVDEMERIFGGPSIMSISGKGHKRTLHVSLPVLCQRPNLWPAHTDDPGDDTYSSTRCLEVYMIEGGLILGVDESHMHVVSTYPNLERWLSGTCGLSKGDHFFAWFTGDK
jgi:hypothetical protein